MPWIYKKAYSYIFIAFPNTLRNQMTDKLPLDAKIALTAKMVDDLDFYVDSKSPSCPAEQHFKIVSRDEDLGVERSARLAAFNDLSTNSTKSDSFKKVAFDTRRIDQDRDRNPRRNLQYWHRAEEFIDEESREKIEAFDKLAEVVNELKDEFESQPEWFDSYARVLDTNLNKVKIKKEGYDDIEVFKPHLSYLEQLIYNRYRYTLKDIQAAPKREIRDRLLSRDEDLKYKREFLQATGSLPEKKTGQSSLSNEQLLAIITAMNSNNTSAPQQSPKDALAELFGGNSLRRDGERSVERTITIKITENVVD